MKDSKDLQDAIDQAKEKEEEVAAALQSIRDADERMLEASGQDDIFEARANGIGCGEDIVRLEDIQQDLQEAINSGEKKQIFEAVDEADVVMGDIELPRRRR